jgi:hypothetical protein
MEKEKTLNQLLVEVNKQLKEARQKKFLFVPERNQH